MSKNDSFLRVLVEPKDKRGHVVWIATCLETGYVASGNECESARDAILAMLREEYTYAKKHNNLRAFYRSPIPQVLLDRWEDATRDKRPKRIPLFPEWGPVELVTLPRAA